MLRIMQDIRTVQILAEEPVSSCQFCPSVGVMNFDIWLYSQNQRFGHFLTKIAEMDIFCLNV